MDYVTLRSLLDFPEQQVDEAQPIIIVAEARLAAIAAGSDKIEFKGSKPFLLIRPRRLHGACANHSDS